jgi:hypothetical protein
LPVPLAFTSADAWARVSTFEPLPSVRSTRTLTTLEAPGEFVQRVKVALVAGSVALTGSVYQNRGVAFSVSVGKKPVANVLVRRM